ncbi:MAG TPA: rRNA adenine N-6-methyltransferase family protein, partial [Gemmatimonadaceae bacterium]|nr:rRNA adenine N-6-methyltransferase family protein [Gemmatimonadaceae bacterium]
MAAPIENEQRGPRRRLVELLQQQGIRDLAVLNAIDRIPRHLFVPTGVRHRAYEDSALPIGNGQTISQPSIHARYLELLKLKGNEKVLEIGTGSGYQTALLSVLASQVFSIERIPALLDNAREAVRKVGARNISFLLG